MSGLEPRRRVEDGDVGHCFLALEVNAKVTGAVSVGFRSSTGEN
jgi:hypothetical protein